MYQHSEGDCRSELAPLLGHSGPERLVEVVGRSAKAPMVVNSLGHQVSWALVSGTRPCRKYCVIICEDHIQADCPKQAISLG